MKGVQYLELPDEIFKINSVERFQISHHRYRVISTYVHGFFNFTLYIMVPYDHATSFSTYSRLEICHTSLILLYKNVDTKNADYTTYEHTENKTMYDGNSTGAEMDNLLLVDKIYKQNTKSAIKHAAAVFTALFEFCL